jgi:hypothetical protein
MRLVARIERQGQPQLLSPLRHPLTFQADDHPDEVDITTCSLDHPEAVPPRDHTYTSGKVHWIQLSDGLAHYAQARTNRLVATCGPVPPFPGRPYSPGSRRTAPSSC